jgi:hypothetical protein
MGMPPHRYLQPLVPAPHALHLQALNFWYQFLVPTPFLVPAPTPPKPWITGPCSYASKHRYQLLRLSGTSACGTLEGRRGQGLNFFLGSNGPRI